MNRILDLAWRTAAALAVIAVCVLSFWQVRL